MKKIILLSISLITLFGFTPSLFACSSCSQDTAQDRSYTTTVTSQDKQLPAANTQVTNSSEE